MKLGLVWIILGAILLVDGGFRIALFGWPGLSGVVFAIPLFYWGIKRLQRSKSKQQARRGNVYHLWARRK